ncbi:hypothetical protein J7L68_00445 [bacterium]|nr:hypothetical protein [bacterium]
MNIIRIWKIVVLFWENRRIISPIILAFFLISLIYAIFTPNQYTSNATFLPSGTGGGPFGFITGWIPSMLENTTSDEISSFLFPEILKSRSVIIEVAHEPFDSILVEKTGKNNLQELNNWRNDNDIIDGFILNSNIFYSFERGIIQIKYTSKYPYLSYFVMKTWVDKLHRYLENNLETEARRNYEYLLKRQDDVKRSLDKAEDSLAIFIKTHRNYNNDPITNLEYQKLSVLVQTRRDLFTYIAQQLETERLNMTKSLPTVKLLDPPNIPQKKSAPKRSLIVIAGIFIGLIIAIIILLLKNSLQYINAYRISKIKDE